MSQRMRVAASFALSGLSTTVTNVSKTRLVVEEMSS